MARGLPLATLTVCLLVPLGSAETGLAEKCAGVGSVCAVPAALGQTEVEREEEDVGELMRMELLQGGLRSSKARNQVARHRNSEEEKEAGESEEDEGVEQGASTQRVNVQTVYKVFKDCAQRSYEGSLSQYGYSSDSDVACWHISDSIRKLLNFVSLLQKSALEPDRDGAQRQGYADHHDAFDRNDGFPRGHPLQHDPFNRFDDDAPVATAPDFATLFKNCASRSDSLTQYGYSTDPDVACWKIGNSIRQFKSKWRSMLLQKSANTSESDGDGAQSLTQKAQSDARLVASEVAAIFKDCGKRAISGSYQEYGYKSDVNFACWHLSDSIRKLSGNW